MLNRILSALFLVVMMGASAVAQTSISGVINSYTAVTAFNGGCNSVTVESAAGLEPGDRVLLIQMKGAEIDLANAPGFGSIGGYGNAGYYEFATVERIDDREVTFRTKLLRTYTPAALVQLVRVPRYTNVVISGTLSCEPWNGSTGGVLALEVSGQVRFAGNIDVSMRGFRGGEALDFPMTPCNGTDYFYRSDYHGSANKGEGIAVLREPYFRGHGAAANAGGSGNDHNGGGGGGANGGAGGAGAPEYGGGSCAVLPGSSGVGGYPLSYGTENRIFLGGGGGAGQGNNLLATSGGAGGGIVIIRAGSIDGGGRSILADGGSVGPTGNDGGGGGGAGGTILLDVPFYSGSLNLYARGGTGGTVDWEHGPGGGGGGGVVWTAVGPPAGSVSLAGGASGIAAGVSRGAEPGFAGRTLGGLVIPEGKAPNVPFRIDAGRDTTVCFGGSVHLQASGAAGYRWEPFSGLNNASIPDPIVTPQQTTTYIVTGRSAGGCYASDTITVTVLPKPKVAITSSRPLIFCPGDSAVLDAGDGFRGYRWSTGETGRRLTVRAAGRYTVLVTDSAGCTWNSESVEVLLRELPVPRITPGDTLLLCDSGTVELDAGAGYARYRWSNGSANRGIVADRPGDYWVEVTDSNGCTGASQRVTVRFREPVKPRIAQGDTVAICIGDSAELSVMGSYEAYQWRDAASGAVVGIGNRVMVRDAGEYLVEVTDSNGCAGTSERIVVQVSTRLEPAIVMKGNARICEGDSLMLDAGAEYAAYRWQWSASGTDDEGVTIGVGSRTIAARKPGNYWVEVRSASGCAGTSERVTVEVVPLPAPSIVALGELRFCQGDSVLLDAGAGYGSYLWSTGDTARYLAVRQSGRYWVEVSGDLGCTGRSATIEVEVSPYPSPAITVAGDTIFCEGDSVLLDAGAGYESYLWSTGDTVRSIVVRAGGSYSVEVANAAGCAALSAPVAVRVYASPPLPVVTASGDTLISSEGESYQWYRDGEPVARATERMLIAMEDGFYTVEHRNAIGCGSRSMPVRPEPGTTDIAVAEAEGAPGELVMIPLELRAASNLPNGGARTFEAEIRFNGTLLMPYGATPHGRMSEGERTIRISGERPEGMTSGVLAQLQFRVLLGDTTGTPVHLEWFRWGTGEERLAVSLAHGAFRLIDLCRTGPTRLVRGDGSFVLKPAVPNPASGPVLFEFELLEHGRTSLHLTDLLGRRVATVLEQDLAPGRYTAAFDAGDVPSGLYLYTLQTPTDCRSEELVVRR